MIKLIATDLDGTLLYPKDRIFTVPKTNRQFLRELGRYDVDIIFVSGRSPKILDRLNKIVGKKCKLLGCNGAYVYHDGKLLESHPMDRKKLTALFSQIYGRFGIFAYFLFDEHAPLYICFRNLPDSFIVALWIGNKCNGAYKEDIVHGEEKFLRKLQESDNYKMMLSFGFGDDARERARMAYLPIKEIFPNDFSVVVSNTALEITAKGVDKGVGLVEYCKQNGIAPDEVVVVGDSGNDLSMFSCFPHSFAMEHAPAFVKDNANHVIRRVSDLRTYLEDPSLMATDRVRKVDLEKVLS